MPLAQAHSSFTRSAHSLAAAEAAELSNTEAIEQVTRHVIGIDVHPVAVILCRVTYLLAIGRDRNSDPNHPPITIPVYLGDAVQWEQRHDVLDSVHEIRIVYRPGMPTSSRWRWHALRRRPGFPTYSACRRCPLRPAGQRAGGFCPRHNEERARPNQHRAVGDKALRDHGRGRHRRGKHFSNLCALSSPRVETTCGATTFATSFARCGLRSPTTVSTCSSATRPGCATARCAPRCRSKSVRCRRNGTYSPAALGASARDLATLFVARAVELYLRLGGAFACVMPHGALSRRPHTGFRSGDWSGDTGDQLTVAFGESWDLKRAAAATGFPILACVVLGKLSESPWKMSTATVGSVGRLPRPDVRWAVACEQLKTRHIIGAGVGSRRRGGRRAPTKHGSVQEPSSFRGSRCSSWMRLRVRSARALGRVRVTSRRYSLEKRPWKDCASVRANVENRFVRTVLLGEQVLPFRPLAPLEAVLPVGDTALLTADEFELHDGLNAPGGPKPNRRGR